MGKPFRSEKLFYKGLDLQNDLDLLATIRQDPVAFYQAGPELLVPHTREHILGLMNKFNNTSLICVIICLPPPQSSRDSIPIGWIRLKSEGSDLRNHRRSEIGISLAEPYRNQGYGSEAIRWMLKWGFTRAGLHRIGINTPEYNDGARRLYERLGFVREGMARECVLHEDRWWGWIEFSMLEHEWRAMEKEYSLPV